MLEWRMSGGSSNTGILTGKLREIVDVVEGRLIDVLCIQETRKGDQGGRQWV